MLRFLNIVAILSLMGSAVYAYTIKYQTSYRAEQIAKTKIEIKQERDAIAVLRAEWAFMTRPERLQQLVDTHLSDMKQLELTQIVTARQLPDKAPRVDTIGQKLDTLLGAPETPASEPEITNSTPTAAPKVTTAPKTATTTSAKTTAAKTTAAKTTTTTTPKTSTTAKAQPSGQKKL